MITKEEYKKALEIVEQYHEQFELQIVSKCDDSIVKEKFELIEGLGKIISSNTVATITTKHHTPEEISSKWIK